MNYSQVKKAHGAEHRAPLVVCELKPTMFAHSWNKKPAIPVNVGLRLLSVTDENNARAAAEEYITKFEHDDIENKTELYNTTLMAAIVGKALCNPNDADMPCEMFPYIEESELAAAFGSQTLKYLFEELERVKVANGLGHQEATDEELERLREYLGDGSLKEMPRGSQRLVRRFARFILEELCTIG